MNGDYMDTSEQYIDMCEKAIGVQQLCVEYGKNYNWYKSLFLTKQHHVYESWYQYKHGENIWIPRQDQLQDILGDYNICMQLIYGSVEYSDYPNATNFTTMEQLWLAIVMKTKFDKRWSGTKWISE